MGRYRLAAAAHVLGMLALTAPAAAQDVASAEALFDRGLAAMKAGNYNAGCPALSQSHRLDPRPGTLFTLAECEAKRGRISTAVVHYNEYLAIHDRLPPEKRRSQGRRAEVARAQVAALGPQVPKLSVALPGEAPAGVTVMRDGVSLIAEMLGVALPMDPGEHVIVVQAPDGARSEQRVTLAPGETRELHLTLPRA